MRFLSYAMGLTAVAVIGCGSSDTGTSATVGSAGGGFIGASGGAAGGGQPGGSSGGASGNSSSGGGSSTSGGGPSNGTCATQQIDAYGLAPDMLIVLDRSTSMQQAGRWQPSVDAVKTITSEFEGLIAFGLEYFPGGDGGLGGLLGGLGGLGGLLGGGMTDGGADVVMCGGMEKLDVPLMLMNAMPIAQSVDANMPGGLTPTGPALQTALQVLGDRNQQLDAVVKRGYVLLVTDGDPSCNPLSNGDAAQQDAARAAVKALKDANIPTYVIGYQIDPNFVGLMNELAMLGGTMQYHPVENGDQIVAAFREITKDVVSCTFNLDMVPADPKYVRVKIDDVSIPLNDPNGWVIDGASITLQGNACATLKDGKGHTVQAQVECTEVILN